MDETGVNEGNAKVSKDSSSALTSSGLGIDVSLNSPTEAQRSDVHKIRRTPVRGSKSLSEQVTPESANPLISEPPTSGLSGSTQNDALFSDFDFTDAVESAKRMAKQSVSSLQSNPPSMYPTSERSLLHKNATSSIQEHFDEFAPRHICNSSKHFKKGMDNWFAIMTVSLSALSTILSGAFLFIALSGTRYHRKIGTDGMLTASNAAFVTSLFAKMTELSFVTVIVAFLGQSLARRAYRKEAQGGVTLAEMNMRSWIIQPGTMFIHWESVRYASASWLGVIALVSAVMAMLYTSAATALVQPQLRFSGWEKRSMQGPVVASFANEPYIQQTCKTPITNMQDDTDDAQETCVSIEHASQAYHNYQHWLGIWHDIALGGNGTRDLSTRPPGWALLNDNATITAPWIERVRLTSHKETGWVINNATMAMPHVGVVSAALDPANNIMQPEELNGQGIYSIRASVPVPFVNVICVMGLSELSLQPLIRNSSTIPNSDGAPFDDIFQWGSRWGAKKWPPSFKELPSDYNTVTNDTTGMPYGRNAVYVLGKGGPADTMDIPTDVNYALCELRVGQTPQCSTQYNASSNVATLEAICEQPDDDLRYLKSLSNAATGNASVSEDWPNIGSIWLSSLNLNNGALDSNASMARLWTEFILTNDSANWEGVIELSNALPSPAEALAVMSGCTLIQSAQGAPFVEFWNYSSPLLDTPQTQWFNASVRAQQYASGGSSGYQKGFYIVLFVVFFINTVVLISWFINRAWYLDFSDPTNLFSLAINSPPSEKLADCSCGGSPRKGEQFKYYWRLGTEGGHVYMESPELDETDHSSTLRSRRTFGETFEMVTSPVVKAVGSWKKR